MTPAKLIKTVVAALDEIKARDVEVLDVKKLTTLFDRMIIASGDSTRQTRAIANNVVEKVKAGGGMVYGVEGEDNGEWILVDLGDVLVHVMQTAVRAHYNLEELWAQAARINKISENSSRKKPAARPPAAEEGETAPATPAKTRKARVTRAKTNPDDER
ncbi:MAG: ribosome silencing factor [Nitrosomonadales bacterium SCN 54-20]|nr:MAG: ribosome silencing factor [Nitrosomonadales bacterium SCN 54-20]